MLSPEHKKNPCNIFKDYHNKSLDTLHHFKTSGFYNLIYQIKHFNYLLNYKQIKNL